MTKKLVKDKNYLTKHLVKDKNITTKQLFKILKFLSLFSALSDNIGKSFDDPANISEIDLLIRPVNIRLRSTNSHCNDLSVRVFLFKLFEERNGSSFAKSSNSQAVEIAVRSFSESCIQPGLKLSLLPATASVTTL